MSDRPNRMLEFLTTPLRPEGEASRGNRRHRCRTKIQVSWPIVGGWQTVRGRMLDISRAGASALSPSAPPLNAVARIRLTEGEGTPWIEVEVIGVEVENYKRARVRFRFLEPCPSFVLRLAVLGPVESAAEDSDTAPVGEGPAGSLWTVWSPTDGDENCSNLGDRMAC